MDTKNILPTQDDINIYTRWLILYIFGDRVKSQKIITEHRMSVIKSAMYFNVLSGVKIETVYRGVLVNPTTSMDDFDLWLYDHNSWTENKDVAIAFSTNDTIYGLMFPPEYIGHIFTETKPFNHFCWFHWRWAEHISKDMKQMVRAWNQKEVILGRMI